MIKMKEKTIPPIIVQMSCRKLGMYSSSYMGNDIYYLIECINLLVSYLGEEFVKKGYTEKGKDWNKIKVELEKINKVCNKIKIFYDPIIDKKFEKKGDEIRIQKMFKSYFTKTASKIPLLQRDIYDLFIFLLENTTLHRNQIPADAFKVLEHTGMRKMDYEKRRVTQEGALKE